MTLVIFKLRTNSALISGCDNVLALTTSSQWLNSAGTGRNGVPQPVSGVPPPEIAVPPPKIVAPPHGDALMVHTAHCIFWSVDFRENHYNCCHQSLRRQILRLKCTKFYFGWGSTPDPAGGAYSAPPGPLAGFKGPTSKRRERRGGKGKGAEGKEGKGRGEEGKGGEEMYSSTTYF